MTRTMVAALRRGQRWIRLDRLIRRAAEGGVRGRRAPRLDGLGERLLKDIGVDRLSGRGGDRYRTGG